MSVGKFPALRMRRARAHSWSRALVRDCSLSVDDLIWPIFVHSGSDDIPVPSMPGVHRLARRNAKAAATQAKSLGIPAIAVFPVIDDDVKDENGTEAVNDNNLVCQVIAEMKSAAPEVGIICDVALDPFTSHGQDGILEDGKILNDQTVEVLCQQAVVQSKAGADVVAPSDMMDGRIAVIRAALDQSAQAETILLSYAAKYASAYYGPFRDAVGSKAALGAADKRTYQMDPASRDEALREVALDLAEGADWVMVKPGMPYLDVAQRVKTEFGVPTFAYQVSGEYAMLKAAAGHGWLDWQATVTEAMFAFKRAGVDGILTYAAPEIAKWLQK